MKKIMIHDTPLKKICINQLEDEHIYFSIHKKVTESQCYYYTQPEDFFFYVKR